MYVCDVRVFVYGGRRREKGGKEEGRGGEGEGEGANHSLHSEKTCNVLCRLCLFRLHLVPDRLRDYVFDLPEIWK